MSMNPLHTRSHSSVSLFIVVVGALIIAGIIHNYAEYFWGNGYVIEQTMTILQLIIEDDDSWWPMYQAALARLYGDGIYQTIFFEQQMKFQYPPFSVLPFVMLIKQGYDWEAIRCIANMLSFLMILGIAVCVYRIITTVFCKNLDVGDISISARVSFGLIAIFGTFSFYPIVKAQYLGQVQIFLDFIIALSILFLLANRKYSSGALLAVAALVKPQFSLMLVWALIRRERDLLIGMITVFIPAGIISLYFFGFQEHVDYLKALSIMGQHGEVYWHNQSINGILNRLLNDGNSLEFTVNSYAPYNAVVHLITLLSTAVLILAGLFMRPSKKSNSYTFNRSTDLALDMGTMLLILTIASPIAWYHHYGILWPIYIAAFIIAAFYVHSDSNGPKVSILLLLVASFILVANSFTFALNEKFADPPLNMLQSHYLLGGFFLLTALWLLRRFAFRVT